MDQAAILNVMKTYFEKKQPSMVSEPFSDQPLNALLEDSLDVVDFLFHLEENLEIQAEVDIEQLMPKLMNKKCGDAAFEILHFVSDRH